MMETKNIGLYWAAGIGAVLLIVGAWFLFWNLSESATNRRYEINTDSQQYQASLVAQLRSTIVGYDKAVDESQKEQLKITFCSIYPNLTIQPADLKSAYERVC